MKNLIYITTFLKAEYGEMCEMLLDSIIKYYNSDTYELYIFVDDVTNNILQEYLKNKKKNTKLNFEVKLIQCKINNIVLAAAFRMFIFNYLENKNFNKILYLDTDVLINKSLDDIFNINIENKLHAVMEGGHIPYHCMYHTKDEFEKYKENDCFSSGILLFDTSPQLKEYFTKLNTFFINGINSGIQIGCCIDQPFFNVIAHRMNCLNNKILGKYVYCNPLDITGQAISHFAGNVGEHQSKLPKMKNFIINNKLL